MDDNPPVAGSRAPRTDSLHEVTYTRITVRSDQMGGTPCIRGLRIPASTVVDLVADGLSAAEIVEAYPDLEPDDVTEALRYAAEAVRERELPLAAAG
jgi:uncharacterized protein (DUF433 family)